MRVSETRRQILRTYQAAPVLHSASPARTHARLKDPCNATTDGRTSEYLRYQLPTLGLSHLSPASVSFHRAVLFFFIPISDSFLRILTHHPHYVKTHPILCASQRSRHAAPSGGRLLARLKSFELHYQTKYCTPGAAIDSTTLTMALQGEQSPT